MIRAELRGQVDDQLTGPGRAARAVRRRGGPGSAGGFGPDRGHPGLPPRAGGAAPFAQLRRAVGRGGRRCAGRRTIPVTAEDRAIAAGDGAATLSDRDADDGTHLRVLTVAAAARRGRGDARRARSPGSTTRWRGCGSCCGSSAWRPIALAALLGARVAGRFAALLERVEAAQTAQRALVADASHELRTPVTALRTNAELLREDPGGDHRAVLDDVVEQTEELSALVTDLIELARGDGPADELQDVRLDALVGEALERARRHAPGIAFAAALEPVARRRRAGAARPRGQQPARQRGEVLAARAGRSRSRCAATS